MTETRTTEWTRAVLIVLATLLGAWWLGGLVVDKSHAVTLSDNLWYFKMASGDYSVPKPFNTRIVLPWLAGRVSKFTGCELMIAFSVLQHAAFAMLHVFSALSIHRLFSLRLATCFGIAAVCLLSPGFSWLLGATYYPDLLFIAWTSLTIWAWLRGHAWLVALSLFLALITRDSSALPLALVIMIHAWMKKSRALVLAPVSAVLLQQAFFKWVYATAATNVHNLSEVLYLPLKLVMNSSRSYLGLRLWSNTLGDNPITAPSNPMPEWTWSLPEWLRVGGIHTIGIYPWSGDFIVETFVQMAVTFGLPLMISFWFARKMWNERHQPQAAGSMRIEKVLILLYGLMMLFLAPATGTDVPRLLMSAWSAPCLVGVGWLACKLPSRALASALLLSSMGSWLLFLAWRESSMALRLIPGMLPGALFLLVVAVLGRHYLVKLEKHFV